MRIAYLILCHKNPRQVEHIIESLSMSDSDFYVHVDRKANAFELSCRENIFFVPDEKRIDVRWASPSMIDATLALIECMLSSSRQYDYVCLLSGYNFPIKSKEYINAYLKKHNGCNFIQVINHRREMYQRLSKRNSIYYPRFLFSRKAFAKIIKRLYIYLTGGFNRTFKCFKRRNTVGMEFEFGSQWWCLTFDCVKWMKEYVDTHKEYRAYFENCLTPDECFFQTLFMNSPFKDTKQGKLTYLEWDINGNNPKVFGKKDYDLLISRRELFARKFDMDVDSEIITMLAEYRDGDAKLDNE